MCKHKYEDCLVETPDKRVHKVTRCKHCGAIGVVSYKNMCRDYTGRLVLLTDTEVRDLHRDLPIYEVDNLILK